jgi:hypothetical protein
VGIIQFDIRHPDARREAIVIEGERAMIGSASHCDVRLPMDQAAYEHVLIESFSGTLRAEAKADHPPATINNLPLNASALSPDSVLGIGRIRIFVTFVPDLAEGGGPRTKEKSKSNPMVQLGLVVMFGLGAYVLLADDEVPIAPPPAQAPELFAATAPTCPQSDPSAARAFALEQCELGDTKRERVPFAVKEGVEAVSLFELGAACFKVAGAQDDARYADEIAKGLKRELVDDFRARRIRLSHVLEVKDYGLAIKDVQVLSALTDGKKGPYVEWLHQTAQQLKGKDVEE